MHYLLPLEATVLATILQGEDLHFVHSAGSKHMTLGVNGSRRVGLPHLSTYPRAIHVMSVEDKLKIVASAALNILFSSHAVTAPISSFDLLTRVVASGPPPAGLFPTSEPAPRFRLVDLARFERILERLADNWDQGTITLSREEESDGSLTVMDVRVGAEASGSGQAERPHTSPMKRKRKRVVDEEEDSAAGGAEEEETTPDLKEKEAWKPPPTTLESLNKTMKEVYALMQLPSAKGRLLAEQVRALPIHMHGRSLNCGDRDQFRSISGSFEPICPHITKDECARARREAQSTPGPPTGIGAICDRIHFRPLLRPHTDPLLGHCSYLNTCYSEPTYAQSPSIPPLPSHRQMQYGAQGQGPVSLPSGLGAGGRGKEKAPCRYLHFEVDWDVNDGQGMAEQRMVSKKKPYRLKLGLGPEGKEMTPVRTCWDCLSAGSHSQLAQLPPQWINCDLRRFDYSVLGKFHVIMADPPWDIHMSVSPRLSRRSVSATEQE